MAVDYQIVVMDGREVIRMRNPLYFDESNMPLCTTRESLEESARFCREMMDKWRRSDFHPAHEAAYLRNQEILTRTENSLLALEDAD